MIARRDPAEALLNEKCDQVERGLYSWFKAVPGAIVMLIALAAVALLVNVSLTISVFSLIALTLLLLNWAVNRARQRRGSGETEVAFARRRVGDHLRQLPLAAGYTLNGPPAGEVQPLLARLRAALAKMRTGDAWVLPLMLAFGGLAACFALLLAGMNVLRLEPGATPLGDLTVAGIVVLQCCLLAAIVPIVQLVRLRRNLSPAETSASEIFTYLDKTPSISPAPDARPVAALAEKVELENVRLADRDGHLLLDDLTLAVPRGQRVAVIATDSQVPLALAGLLVRFYDPAAGRVLWDGHDLRHAEPNSLRRQAVVVADDGLIFDGTVTQNIQCGNGDYTQLQLTDAAKMVRAYNFIQQLPQGFSTPLGDGGRRLNAAQSFRLALARAAVREPSLVVVQEPAAAMEDADGALIDDALRRLGDGRTLIVLAARLETLRGADSVCLIHEGKLAAAGPHFGLLQSSSLYRHVNYMRYNEFGTAVR
jgi:ABC-type multidrug transport system fused ATPase/permease subunit